MDGRIQINNADNKNATVSKMVILRACLYDIYKDVRNLNQIQESNRQCDNRRTEFKSKINDLTAANDKKQYEDQYSAKRESLRQSRKEVYFDFDWDRGSIFQAIQTGVAFAILGAIICAVLILKGIINVPLGEFFLVLNNYETIGERVIVGVLGTLTGVAMGVGCGIAGFAIYYIFVFFIVIIKGCCERQSERNDISLELREVNAEEKKYFKKSGGYNQMVVQNNKQIEELKSKIKTENENFTANNYKIKELQTVITKKWNSCARVFSSVLHSSDFENVDYLLYLFITGRADTTKEALQLVDKAKRTEAIIGAINASAQYLANNFAVALNDLKGSIVVELKSIKNSLNSMHSTLNSMHGTLKGIRNDIGQMHDQLNHDLVGIANSIDMNAIATMSFAASTRQMLSEINQKQATWTYVNGELVAR